MNRRKFPIRTVGTAAAVGRAWRLRPSDEGGAHDGYFRTLSDELGRSGPMRPCMVIDLDRVDHNIDVVRRSVRAPRQLRIVAKSLPSVQLIDYIFARAQTRCLMAFHQPFLNLEAEAFPTADILLGKPLPVAASAHFYERLKGSFDPARQLQWLLDTPERLAQYLELARGQRLRLRVNIEIDVGLHRGGVTDNATLRQMLKLLEAFPQQVEFAGFMGYDPHVVKVPRLLGSHRKFFEKALATYRGFVDYTRREHAALFRHNLTLNTAGSSTYKLHEEETLTNDVAVGSGFVKPTDFDLATLAKHRPAAFIATPVLKRLGPVSLPGLDGKSRILSLWDPNLRQTFFIYGGNWMAEYVSPPGLRRNALYGHSSNQEIVNGSESVALRVDDQVFLRPRQSEAVLQQFGDLVTVRAGKIQDRWAVLTQTS
jgi:D-serine deaminase-like pyridoxal phosphate-dependent protein